MVFGSIALQDANLSLTDTSWLICRSVEARQTRQSIEHFFLCAAKDGSLLKNTRSLSVDYLPSLKQKEVSSKSMLPMWKTMNYTFVIAATVTVTTEHLFLWWIRNGMRTHMSGHPSFYSFPDFDEVWYVPQDMNNPVITNHKSNLIQQYKHWCAGVSGSACISESRSCRGMN